MTTKKYTISIALCTYNGERFLKEQLESIINQTRQPDEIIICDDRSKDNSVNMAKSILTQWTGKWQIVINDKNLGFRKNFEKAMKLCQGDIIFLSDQDDVWDERKIEKMILAFDDPDVILAFHDAYVVDEELHILHPSLWEIMKFDPEPFKNDDFRIVFLHNVMQGTACCFRKKLCQIAMPFSDNAYHDEWLLLIALCSGKVMPVKEKFLKYRQAQNIVGGIPVSKVNKLKEWMVNANVTAKEHIEYIKGRKSLCDELLKHFYGRKIIKLTFYNKILLFDNFLKHRLLAIKNMYQFPKGKEYKYWYFKNHAKKQRLKDCLSKTIICIYKK